jgi:hypothetical protein
MNLVHVVSMLIPVAQAVGWQHWEIPRRPGTGEGEGGRRFGKFSFEQ